MNRENRIEAFKRLFNRMKGQRHDKIMEIADVLHVEENTVRGWLIQEPHRAISQAALDALAEYVKTGERPIYLYTYAFAPSKVRKAIG